MTCKARQYSDQKVCKRCDLVWDMNDIDPPKCLTSKELATKTCKQIYKELER